jgi:hypothetical protein
MDSGADESTLLMQTAKLQVSACAVVSLCIVPAMPAAAAAAAVVGGVMGCRLSKRR